MANEDRSFSLTACTKLISGYGPSMSAAYELRYVEAQYYWKLGDPVCARPR